MLSDTEGHTVFLCGFLPCGADVSLRSDVYGIEAVHLGVVVEEVVVVCGLCNEESRAGTVIESHQLIGIKLFGFP